MNSMSGLKEVLGIFGSTSLTHTSKGKREYFPFQSLKWVAFYFNNLKNCLMR